MPPEMQSAVLPDLDDFAGLKPKAWICAGNGFSREDVKALLFSHGMNKGLAFGGDAVHTLQSLWQRIAGIDSGKVLQSPARQEVLRLLLSVAGLRERFPELKRLKRQGAFLRRLDTAIQSGRMAFAHWEEASVYSERLGKGADEGALRREIEILARAYEDWLSESGYWDTPLVARKAVEVLNSGSPGLPEAIYHLSLQTQESLERSFWDALGRHTRIVTLGPASHSNATSPRVRWLRWHTLDDAAEALVDELGEKFQEKLKDSVVLISDIPSSRRSLKRALDQHGIPLADPRDPTRIRWDEAVKQALLPLETAARGFERPRVIAYLRSYLGGNPEWIGEIHDRGIRAGLNAFAGGKLAPLHRELGALGARFGGKKTVQELAEAHLTFLSETGQTQWARSFFEQIWVQLIEDLERVGLGERRAGALYWLERLQSRVSESQAPVERLRPLDGLDVYRVHQAPPRAYRKVFVFGLPPLWLSPGAAGGGVGDYWFSERDREILAGEFAVRSAMQVRGERLEALRAWLAPAEEAVFLDACYEPDGREREAIRQVLEELGFASDLTTIQAEECGCHPRWLASYGALRPIPPQEARLPALAPETGSDHPVISASALENYSRCGFLALARQRWRLDDLQEPDTDLWPHVKGILLHDAVRLLVESRDADGNFSKSAEEVIDLAWNASKGKRPKGLLSGSRIESYVKGRLVALLRVFVEQEKKYVRRSGTRVLGLENIEFNVDYEGGGHKFSVVGDPDRVDEHPDGLWIIDYKTSSQAPNGSVMLENGYRLQLPFYALAAQKKFAKPALGFQFVQLDRKGTRTNGVYFKTHNGKEPGKLTDTRSKSLLALPREEVWERFEREIEEQGVRYVSGEFTAAPRVSPRAKECASCAVSDFCGYRRLMEEEEEGGA